MLSEAAYEKYVKKYADTVLRIAVNYCRDMADAEDIVQEVFLKLYEADMEFADEEHVKRWLIRVAVNHCKNHIGTVWHRRVQMTEPWNMEQVMQGQAAAFPFAPDSGNSILYHAVTSLPEKYRSVVHLYYFEDYSVREIAEILKKKETTIQTRLMRARKMLKEQLKGAWRDEPCK